MKTTKFIMAFATAVMIASCSSDNTNEWVIPNQDGTNSQGGTTGGDSSTSGDTDTGIVLSEDDNIDNTTFSDTIAVVFSGTTASVAGTADGVAVNITGADVIVTSTSENNIMYMLSGTTADGMFKIYSDHKFGTTLNGVNITNTDGPAINIQSKKRNFMVVASGTVNTLADGSSYADSDEDQKATIFSEGQLIFSGSGTLQVTANYKHGICSDDYLNMAGGVITINAGNGHGLKANDFVALSGGTLNINVSGTAKKGISSDGQVTVNGGTTTINTTGGGKYDSDEGDVTAAAGIKADSAFVINGGTLIIKSTGAGGKGISTDGTATFNGGNVSVTTTGRTYTYNSSLDSKAKGIKADGNIVINDGVITISATGGEGSEGMESKGVMYIKGGQVTVSAYDDGINSAGDMIISGGYVFAQGTNNDAIDANGNCYIQGGTVYAIGASSPEVAIDANSEGGYQLYFQGGNLIAIGGLEQGSNITQTCYQTTAWSANTWYALYNGSASVIAFRTPSSTSINSTMIVSTPSTPTLQSAISVSGGTSYFAGMANIGGSFSNGNNVTLSAYTGGNMGGGPGSNMGGGPGRR